MRSLLSLVLCIFSINAVLAIRFPFQARSVAQPVGRSRLQSRADVTNQIVTTSNGSVILANTLNAEYIVNITLGGEQIPVLIDTGSSDLWVTGTVPNTQDSGKGVKLEYAVGQTAGDIFFADMSFDGYNVSKQAFLLVNDTSSFSTNIQAQGYSGLLGLGPNSGSNIANEFDDDDPSGDSPIDRIFSLNQTSQNYVTILLNRRGDPSDNYTGQITVSELVSGYEGVINQPKLPVLKLRELTDEDQHFQILTDKNVGIIGPDGHPIQVDSIVPEAPDGQLVAVLDSGFTLPQVPRSVSDAIYGRVQGAVYNTTNQLWTIPCTQLLNISFNFGGVNFPIHPLDVSSSDFALQNAAGEMVCAGAFQPITSAFSLLGEYDLILGMGFLRNSYSLFDYGDFIDNSSNDRGDPFVQLLPITDVKQAHNDFVQVRLGGKDTTGDPSQWLVPSSQGQQSPESDAEKKQHAEGAIIRQWPYILLGCLLFVFLVVGLIIWKCCCRRKKGKNGTKKNEANTTVLPLSQFQGQSTYKALDDHYGNSPPYKGAYPSTASFQHLTYTQ